jgi:hypothetical protein
VWTDAGRLEEILARTGNLQVAVAAYQTALLAFPGRHVTLRQGTHVIRERQAMIDRNDGKPYDPQSISRMVVPSSKQRNLCRTGPPAITLGARATSARPRPTLP